MLITKFNKMIRNKLIWGFIAIVISAFFLLASTSMPGCSATLPDTVGQLFGEEVSQNALQTARFFELGLQSERGLDPEAFQILRIRTWQRLAVLRMAEKMGLRTPDSEVALAIGSEPGFSANGAFDVTRYKAFVRSRGVDDQTFEEYLRQDLTMEKVRALLDTIVWTTPSEIDRRLRNLTDERSIEYAIFARADANLSDDLTAEDIRAFFEANQDVFTIPEQVQVRYVSFAYTDHLSTNDIETAVAGYYNDNIDTYTPEATNQFEFLTPLPLDDVRAQIEGIIRERESILAAKDAANEFVYTLAPDRRGRQPSFEDAAAATGLTVQITQPFAAGEPVPGLDVDERFTSVAFRLIPDDPESYFSYAILATNAAFVIASHDKQEAHIPAFEEIEKEVAPLARSNKIEVAFSDYLENIREELASSVSGDTSFSDALADYDVAITTATFSIYSSLLTNVFEHQDLLVPEMIDLRAGDLTEVVLAEDIALIARIVARSPSDPVEGYALRGQLLRTLQRYRTGILYEDYSEYLLRVAEFQDLQAPSPDQASEDNAENSAPAGSGSK